MHVRCLDLVDFLLIAEQVTGIEAETLLLLPQVHLVEHALNAPHAGLGTISYYQTFAEKAAAMTYQLIKGHPLIDGNKRVGYLCLRVFVERNGFGWQTSLEDGIERIETVAMIEGVADGSVPQEHLARWIDARLVHLGNS